VPLPPPQSLNWPSDRALLLVHGVGNARPGDYDSLFAQLKGILADQVDQYAIYMFLYDQVNNWFATKTQAANGFKALVGALKTELDATALGSAAADFAGDVIWPVLIADAREAIRTAFFEQLHQIKADGIRAGFEAPFQKISIIAHSMGCFHTFETLHAAARRKTQGLAPGTHGFRFENVIFMASPVQLIRTMGGAIHGVIPQPSSLTCVSAPQLSMPSERIITGDVIASAKHTVSITGNLDPVGGHLFGNRLEWAYMNLPEQESKVDQQSQGLNEAQLASLLRQSLSEQDPPQLTVQSPHDWGGYVARHAADLEEWLTV